MRSVAICEEMGDRTIRQMRAAIGWAANSQLYIISVMPADGWSAIYVYRKGSRASAVAVRLVGWALAEDDETSGTVRQRLVGIDAVNGDVGATGFRMDLADGCEFVRYLSPIENEGDVIREVEAWENR